MPNQITSGSFPSLAANAANGFPGTSPILYVSDIGTPVFSDLSVQGDTYYDDMGRAVTFPDIDEMSALFVVTQKKIIKRTAINNRPGRIKEYINRDDFEISCAMVIRGTNLNYPDTLVANIIRMLNSDQSLRVNSWYLNNLGIFDIVIDGYSMPQTTGNIGQQIISFTAWSDTPLILQFS